MDFKKWWDTVGSGIRPAISSDMESHAQFVANAAWNAAQHNTKVAEQTPTNIKSMPCCDVCGGELNSQGDCKSRIAHLYGE